MHELLVQSIQCPYCWEFIEILLDCSVEEQRYIEDCQVCCRPIEFTVTVDEYGDPSILVAHEDD